MAGDGGGDGSDATVSQGAARIDPQKPEESRKDLTQPQRVQGPATP